MKKTLGKIGIIFIIGSVMSAIGPPPDTIEGILFVSGGVLFILGDW